MFNNQLYRQNTSSFISFSVKSIKDIDKLIGKNLKRLRVQHKFTQDKLGELIGVDGNVIARVEGSILGMGKKMMIKLCDVFKVNPYEFYIEHDTPLPATDLEKKALYMAREAEQLHVEYIAEESLEYTLHRLEVVKKQAKKGIKHVKPSRSKIVNG